MTFNYVAQNFYLATLRAHSINLLVRSAFLNLFSLSNTFLVFLFCQKDIKLTEILDLSTLVFSENKS